MQARTNSSFPKCSQLVIAGFNHLVWSSANGNTSSAKTPLSKSMFASSRYFLIICKDVDDRWWWQNSTSSCMDGLMYTCRTRHFDSYGKDLLNRGIERKKSSPSAKTSKSGIVDSNEFWRKASLYAEMVYNNKYYDRRIFVASRRCAKSFDSLNWSFWDWLSTDILFHSPSTFCRSLISRHGPCGCRGHVTVIQQ